MRAAEALDQTTAAVVIVPVATAIAPRFDQTFITVMIGSGTRWRPAP